MKTLSIKIWLSTLLAITFFACNTCKAQDDVKALAHTLFSTQNDSSAMLASQKLLKAGKAAIPFLIAEIDRDEKVFYTKRAKTSSFIGPDVMDYVGIATAYFIERILSGESEPYSVLAIYSYRNQKLQYTDMQKIKTAYQNWWEWNKYKSLPQLTADWKQNKRPLTKSEYRWE